MNALRLGLRLVLPLMLFTGLAAAQLPSYVPGPVPPAILQAHKLFLANGAADSGLFPQPFTGDPNRGYDELFSALQTTGEYQIVSDPSLADLVLEIRLIAPYGPANANKQNGAADPLPMFRLEIYDTRTHFRLWTITESIESALLQRTHDRNFDEAVSRLVADFQALRHTTPPVAATPHASQP